MVMTGVEYQEKMQNSYEASLGCPHGEVIPHYPSYGGNFEDGSSYPNEENSGYSLGGIAEVGSLNVAYFVPPTEGCQRPVYPQEVCVWSGYHPVNPNALQNHFYQIDNQLYPMNECYVPDVNQYLYSPFQKLAQLYPSEFNFQQFQYFVVIDFEATCDKEKNTHPQEIIEFPSVLVNSMTGQLEDQFQVYVRPTHNKKLSDFCKELTGIQQTQVDKGVILSEALFLHDKWLESKGVTQTNFVVVTWSNWDCRVMLESECRFKKIRKPPYFDRWINLRVPFHEVFGGIRCNLKEAVQLAGLSWEGRAHCGLDDAKNTARLLTNLMHRGIHFTVTNSLTGPPSEPQTVTAAIEHQTRLSPQPHHHLKPQVVPSVQFNQLVQVVPCKEQNQEPQYYCLCGVKSRRQVVHKPGGPATGYIYHDCGNSTANGGFPCSFFKWVDP